MTMVGSSSLCETADSCGIIQELSMFLVSYPWWVRDVSSQGHRVVSAVPGIMCKYDFQGRREIFLPSLLFYYGEIAFPGACASTPTPNFSSPHVCQD